MNMSEVFVKLPFRLGSEARKKRLKEIIENKEPPIEVNCFSTDKFKILDRKIVVKIFNEKMHRWEDHVGLEYRTICSICGKYMLVRAIQGTTWLAFCSKGCYEKYDQLKKGLKEK